jgi:hypothetical protein
LHLLKAGSRAFGVGGNARCSICGDSITVDRRKIENRLAALFDQKQASNPSGRRALAKNR